MSDDWRAAYEQTADHRDRLVEQVRELQAENDEAWEMRDHFVNERDELAAFSRDLQVQVRQRDEVIERVRALHRPSTDHRAGFDPYCVGCWEAGGDDGAPTYPCPTVAALEGDQ